MQGNKKQLCINKSKH